MLSGVPGEVRVYVFQQPEGLRRALGSPCVLYRSAEAQPDGISVGERSRCPELRSMSAFSTTRARIGAAICASESEVSVQLSIRGSFAEVHVAVRGRPTRGVP